MWWLSQRDEGVVEVEASFPADGESRDGVDEGQGLCDVVDVRCGSDDLERGAFAVADQVVFCCRSCGGRPATGPSRRPPFSRVRGRRPRMRGSSPVRRPRSAPTGVSGAAGRRRPPPASAPVGASRSARIRSPAPGVIAAMGSRCRARTSPPEGTAGPRPVECPATAPAMEAAPARSLPTTHRPRPAA